MFTRSWGTCPARARRPFGLRVMLVAVAQAACTMTAGAPRGGRFSYDTSASAACRQNPANCVVLSGRQAAFDSAPTVGIAVASLAASLKVLDNLTRGSIEQALSECADLARSEVLLRHSSSFHNPLPTIDECNAYTVDARGQRVTWAVRLGTEMHEAASACAEAQLGKLRPGGFSLEPRYRYDSRSGRWKEVSREEERALEASGNGGELKGSLRPDVVLHSGNPISILAIYDYKFRAPGKAWVRRT